MRTRDLERKAKRDMKEESILKEVEEFKYDYLVGEIGDSGILVHKGPVTKRLSIKGIGISDILTLKDLEFESYGKDVMIPSLQISNNVLGVAIQELASIFSGCFVPMIPGDLWNKDLHKELMDIYLNLRADNFDDGIYNRLIDLCVNYANGVNCSRSLYPYEDIDTNLITDSTIYYIKSCVDNIINYLTVNDMHIDFAEVNFGLFHKYVNNETNYSLCFGDLDYITTNSIVDIKCIKEFKKTVPKGICQQLMYYYMMKYGKRRINYFDRIEYVRLYNPILDCEYKLKISNFKNEKLLLKRMFRECYE